MLLSRKWLDEFVHVDANDKDFAEAMTLSGSKVETTEATRPTTITKLCRPISTKELSTVPRWRMK